MSSLNQGRHELARRWRRQILRISTGIALLLGLSTYAVGQEGTKDTSFIRVPFQVSDAGAPTVDLHLEIGRPRIFVADGRVSRIYIANPAVLDSYTVKPQQIVVTPKALGSTALIFWDEAGHASIFNISVDVPIDLLRTALLKALPTERINVTSNGEKISLSGELSSRAAVDTALKIASLFSKEVVDSLIVDSAKAKQVKVKVRFLEVDRARLNQFGINLFAPAGGTAIGAATTSQFPTTATAAPDSRGGNTLTVSNALNFLFYDWRAGIGVSVQDLEDKQLAQVLAEPTITTISGQNASFLAGGEFPFPVVQGASTGTTAITIQFRPYGVKLDFTPKVNVDGTIELRVVPEVSSLDYTNAVSISGYTIPAISTKHVDTQVVLRSGQSFAISGLLDKQTTDSFARTPGLAGVPILGALFRSKSVNLTTSELIVIVTPEIVDPIADKEITGQIQLARPMLDEKRFDESSKPRP